MKKLLLAGTAIAGLALLSAPAMADGLNLDVEGYYRGYIVNVDDDAADERELNFRDDVEVHFTGDTTLDNGLTVGVHVEMDAGADNGDEEQYAYFSGSWGRVNFGVEDGAAYLLQVAAPSADSNVDGLRAYIQGYTDETGNLAGTLDYDNAPFRAAKKISYLTPKFEGFQAGVSYAPEVTDSSFAVGNGLADGASDDDDDDFEDAWEVAARWDGEFEGVGVSIGAGYSEAEEEADTGGVFDDDFKTWDAGIDLDWADFGFGVAYLESNQGIDSDGDLETWVVGVDWNNGPYTLGASWMDSNVELGTGAGEVDLERFTVGGTYTYGPGMTFRGAVAWGEIEEDVTAGGLSTDVSQITLGTDISF